MESTSTNATMSSSGGNSDSSSDSYTFPTNRAQYVHETESTDIQTATEEECAPFFVDLETLSEGQLDHLRNVGLLPPLPVAEVLDADRRKRKAKGKAAKLLGVASDDGSEDDGVIGQPKIELLEEDDGSPLLPDPNQEESNVNATPSIFDPYAIRLLREAHTSYLTKNLCNPLSRGFVSLDASHPWMVYWCLHSLDLLGYFDVEDHGGSANESSGGLAGLSDRYDALKDVEILQKGHLLKRVVSTLEHCWSDVSLEFDYAKEVAGDARLNQLHREQTGSSGKSNESSDYEVPNDGEKVSITGGGFGGGPQQMPHCAPTYAAVLSLSIVSSLGLQKPTNHPYHEAGKLAIDFLAKRRLQLYAFFLTLREKEDGERTSFRMQHDGEIDVRASYCLLAPCYLLGLLHDACHDSDSTSRNDSGSGSNSNPLQHPSISQYIATCQTHEGGFGAEPHNEAHGGYTFCALAALRLLGSVSMVDVNALRSWLARRQMGYEGGFCGRTNKLVDGCYSFWQGGAVAVLDGWCNENENCNEEGDDETDHELSLDEMMLQRYILLCAQDVNGGLRDKPSKPKDFYHTCYNLSGLSVAQHALEAWPPSPLSTDEEETTGGENGSVKKKKEGKYNHLFGDVSVNILGRTDPVINIRVERVRFMLSQNF